VLPNYVNNWKRLGFTDADVADGGSDRLVDALVAWGAEEAISARVQEHVDAGADHVCLQVIHDEDGLPEEQWRRLAGALIG
jgi:probable F420-dependent oxidoreductase